MFLFSKIASAFAWQEVNPQLNFEITSDIIGFLAYFGSTKNAISKLHQTKKTFNPVDLEYIRINSPDVQKIVEAVCVQARENLPQFIQNWNKLLQSDDSFNAIRDDLIKDLLILSSQKPTIYNFYIKQAIQMGLLNDTLKKECILKAIESKNTDLAVWLFSSEGGLHTRMPIQSNYPILLYLVDKFEKEHLETLLSLQKQDGLPIVSLEDLNCEVSSALNAAVKHTPLERVLGRNAFDTRIASLLRAYGATNFGSLSLDTKEKFLTWEQQQLLNKKTESKENLKDWEDVGSVNSKKNS